MTKHTKSLLIFDIDGTLTDSAGLTRVAFEKAIDEIFSVSNSTRGIKPFGRTDRQIFREALQNNNINTDNFNKQFEHFSVLSARHLRREIENSDLPSLHAGIKELLDILNRKSSVYLALGTGNTEINAYIKLEKHGIDKLFPVGGFGSNVEDRTRLIEQAFLNSQAYYGINFEKQNSWVIGDTPFDVICGKNNGFKTIAVATGAYDENKLKLDKPTAVFPDLSDHEKFLSLIKNETV